MPKISLDNLERYDGHLKDWCDARFAERKVHENWHEAGPSGAVSFYPESNRPIDPVVNFAFTETLPEGTKGPDNPSVITGVSSVKVTRCGKNLIRWPYYYETRTINGVTFTVNEDGSITVSGTATARCVFWVNNNPSVLLVKGEGYIISGCPSGGGWNSYSVQVEIRKDGTYVGSAQDFGVSETRRLIAAGDTTRTAHVFIEIASGTTVSNLIFKPQLELGSTVTPFELYSGEDYTVNLGDTYYGGSVDLSTGIMTVTRQYMVADNNADIVWIGTNFVAWRYPTGRNAVGRAVGTEVCSHFPFSGAWDDSFAHFYATPTSGLYLANPDWTASTARQYFTDQYNNGTPVTAVYELATPYTVQLTPQQVLSLSQLNPSTPRINTVYSDQQSILVRYPKSPIVSGSELDDAILSLGGD